MKKAFSAILLCVMLVNILSGCSIIKEFFNGYDGYYSPKKEDNVDPKLFTEFRSSEYILDYTPGVPFYYSKEESDTERKDLKLIFLKAIIKDNLNGIGKFEENIKEENSDKIDDSGKFKDNYRFIEIEYEIENISHEWIQYNEDGSKFESPDEYRFMTFFDYGLFDAPDKDGFLNSVDNCSKVYSLNSDTDYNDKEINIFVLPIGEKRLVKIGFIIDSTNVDTSNLYLGLDRRPRNLKPGFLKLNLEEVND